MAEEKSQLSAREILDAGFLENRARLLEIASFLDRLDRAGGSEIQEDFRYRAFLRAIRMLTDSSGQRTCALQLGFSDQSEEPRESAKGLKGACGAWEGAK